MSQGFIFQFPRARPIGLYGTTLPNSYLVFYNTNTTSLTPIYSNGALTGELSNPIQADSTGQFPCIYLDPGVIYRVQYYDQYNALQWDLDPGAIDVVTSTSGLPPSGVVAGTYTNATVTVAPSGIVTFANTGSGGGGGGITTNVVSTTKTASTFQTNNTILTQDPDLTVTLPAGSYTFQMGLIFSSSTTPNGGIVLGWSLGASPIRAGNLICSGFSNVTGTFAALPFIGLSSSFVQFGYSAITEQFDGAADTFFIEGSFTNNANQTFGLFWAQNTSSAATTVVRTGSYMNIIPSTLA